MSATPTATQSQLTDNPTISPIDTATQLNEILTKQKSAFLKRGFTTYEDRISALSTLQTALGEYKQRIIDAVMSDFGHRSPHETSMTEVLATMGEIATTKKHLKKWMKHQKAPFSLNTATGTGKILYQPKGVVGIMSAWNYPVFLCTGPLVGVIAAGNHAMIKPSDLSQAAGEVLGEMFEKFFDPEYITIVNGDVTASIEFSKLPFNHLVYTGGTEVGRMVMVEAAKNLCPVTLEMGGKSPTLISEDYPIETAVTRIQTGKCMNAGQTCIAPDYVLLPKNKEQEFVAEYMKQADERYPSIVDNQDITWIINDRHYSRVNGLIDDAKEKGAKVHQSNPKNETIPEGTRVIPYTVVTDVTDDMEIMNQEIFGPVLPIVTYTNKDDAINYIRERAHPLALYYFDNDKSEVERVVKNTVSGGVTVNDSVLHAFHENMPFGGIGPSGLGGYHGFDGFREFSHMKGVLYQGRFSAAKLLKAPYGDRRMKIFDYLIDKLS
ncbi:MAG: coniferyl aldehyde dehydrogenase [Pseudomonadales bacterium]|nr:coniferyl aldehyde dehydrogenase [Pseudomonadales bacterium]